MPPRLGFFVPLLLLASAASAGAAPATPEEAARLTTLFERYVGRPVGQSSVNVVPDGESYRAILDLGRVFSGLQPAGIIVTAGALTAELTPRADGTWRVAVDGLPALGIAKDDQSSSVIVDSYRLDGLFDPKIQAFSSSSTQAGGSTSHSTGPKGSSTVTFTGTSTGSSKAEDAGAGTVAIRLDQSVRNPRYDVTVATGTGSAPSRPRTVAFTATGNELTGSLALGQVHSVALNDLWAFLVQHGSKAELVADQTAFKARLRAVLPLASSATGDLSLSKLVVSTSQGVFGAGDLSEHYEVNGATSKDGVLSTLKIAGFSAPAALVPPWAAVLMPTSIDLSQAYGPIDLTPILLDVIDEFDLAAPKPLTDAQVEALKVRLSEGDMAVRIAPSAVSTALATVRVQADLRLTKPLPTGTATIAVTGLDKTIDRIRMVASNDPTAAQVMAALSAVKILAKAEGVDSYSWHIEANPGGEIRVNGNPVGAPPPQPPTIEP